MQATMNLLIGIGALLTGIGALASFRKNRDNGRKIDETKSQVEEVHQAVNGILKDNNIEVPPEGGS